MNAQTKTETSSATPNKYRALNVRKSLMIIEEFRKLDPSMPLHVASAFLLVSLNDGISVQELADALGVVKSTASRDVALLSKDFTYDNPGHDLVYVQIDPRNRRRKEVRVTVKGQRVAASLSAIIGEEGYGSSKTRQ